MTQVPNPDRLMFLLDIVQPQGAHLLGTTGRLFSVTIDADWVNALDRDPAVAERLDAFVVRFGRMQDTIGDKLVPELRRQVLETPGAALDNLNRMEKLGLLPAVLDWVEARNLRRRLVHEYLRDADDFAAALNRARQLVSVLVVTYNRINTFCQQRFGAHAASWPSMLPTSPTASPSDG